MWSSHPDCEHVVAKEWEHQHRGSDMYGFVQRLKCCKEALLKWSKRTFGKDKLQLKVLQGKLKSIQAEPYSQARFEQEKECVKEVEILLLREEMKLHQRSRINWLSYGDRNSAFFHASINQRRQRNQMVKLRSSRGEWIDSEEGINGIIKDFFSGLFSHSGQRNFSEALSVVNSCITEDMNTRLIKEVTEEEIKLAAFQLGSLKAPGPDGYPGLFFQNYWSTVGEGLCKAVKRFFTSGYILKELNQTNIVLIPKNCSKIKSILNVYGEASGQRINFDKSGICFSSNFCDVDKQLCCDFMDVPLMKIDSKYLGLPSFLGKSKAEAYSFIIEKALNKMQGWKVKTMSQGGKEIMLKSVVQAIPSYAMSCFLLPKKLCDKLTSYVSNFWWKGDPESKGIHWRSWETMSKAKSDGGMGFRDFRSMNEAHLARQGWRMLRNPNSYWAKFLKGLYFPNCSFLEAARGHRASWAWMSLLHGRETLMKGLRWQVQNGEKIRFWEDKWIPGLPNFSLTSTKPSGDGIEKVKDVIIADGRGWDKVKLMQIVSKEEADAILKIPISKFQREDFLVWHYTSNGEYSVKSGYHVANQERTKDRGEKPSTSLVINTNLWAIIWKLKVPHKIRHFWWRACSNSLATKENLLKRRCGQTQMCPICNQFDETVEHMLFDCHWARAVWFGSNIQLNVGQRLPTSVIRWTSQVVDQFKKEDAMNYLERIVYIAWYIWKARNEVVFNSGHPNPEWTMRRALEAFREFSDVVVPSRFHMDNPTVEDFISQWRAPENGCFKLNCDAAVGKNGKEASAAVVIRDSKGILVNGSSGLINVSSPLQGELVAIRQACGMISDFGYQNALVESDSQVAIKLSVSELVPPWEVSALVLDIRRMREDLKIRFGWVKRTANKLAHVVAKKGLKGLLPRDWVVIPPNFVSSVLARDLLPFV